MNVSYRWLRSIAPTLTDDAVTVAERLALLGAPVEELRPLARELEEVRVGRVLSVRKHPDADRLSLCQVDGGEGVVQVVCGASNVRADAWYPFAPAGSTLPGGLTLRKAKIRGEVSNGMLCSEKELGLGRDHAGILEIHGDFTPGQPLVDALGLDDWRMDVEVTSNRPDLLSHRGVAREVAPGGDAELVMPAIPGAPPVALELRSDTGAVEVPGIRISIEVPELCPRYLGAVIRGVRVGPSPGWLAGRLRAAGARPINNVVDATNYVLLELGQPLHAFDLARLEGGEIRVRTARDGETIRTLDGEERKLGTSMLCICDARRPVAIAGVMGGEESEVHDGTTDLLLECALFQPARTRATRKALGMSTDASYRFERGVDPEGLEAALRRCVEIILATAGGTVEPLVADVIPQPFSRSLIRLRPSQVERILGIPFTPEQIRERLEPLGFPVREAPDGALMVEVPGFRSWDVRREIDLVEEVARTHGYDRFPSDLGPFRPGTVPDDPQLRLQDGLRSHLAGRGFLEALNLAFAPPADGEVEVMNPLSVEESRLRGSLLPALLRRVSHNFHRGTRDVRLFEIGTTFRPGEPEGLPREETRVALVLTGRRAPAHWSDAEGEVDLWDLKGLLEELVPRAGLHGAGVRGGSGDGSLLDPSAALDVGLGSEGVGHAGRVRAGVVDAPPWAGPVWALELVLPDRPGPAPETLYHPLPMHPAVERDVALLLPGGIEAGAVSDRIRQVGGGLLESVAVFDLYEGHGIPEGFRSVAFRLIFRSPDRTLVEAEVGAAMEGILRAIRESPGVEPRR
jgi:phenylalanyl-tRNA synthetase beta chain